MTAEHMRERMVEHLMFHDDLSHDEADELIGYEIRDWERERRGLYRGVSGPECDRAIYTLCSQPSTGPNWRVEVEEPGCAEKALSYKGRYEFRLSQAKWLAERHAEQRGPI